MNYPLIKQLAKKNGYTIGELAKAVDYTRAGFKPAIEKETIQLNRFKLMCKLLKVKPIEIINK